MKIDGVKYINEALSYAQSRTSTHQVDQEFRDLIYGISLVYKDLKKIQPDIDRAAPKIRKEVKELRLAAFGSKMVEKTGKFGSTHFASQKSDPIKRPVDFSIARKREKLRDPSPEKGRGVSFPGISREKNALYSLKMKGIPNQASNCFIISAYQMVKNNPKLYREIFNDLQFKNDPRFNPLREFDRKILYLSSKRIHLFLKPLKQ